MGITRDSRYYDDERYILMWRMGQDLKLNLSVMKSQSSKRKNNSFISNQDLIEGLRNSSFRNLSKNFNSLDKKNPITLIKKKTYQKENQQPTLTTQTQLPLHDQISSLIKQLSSYCSNKKVLRRAEMAIRRLGEERSQPLRQEEQLIRKIEQLYVEKSKIKKEKKGLQGRIRQLQERIEENNRQKMCKQNEKLHKFILKQSEIINEQAKETMEIREDLQRTIFLQAQSLEKQLSQF